MLALESQLEGGDEFSTDEDQYVEMDSQQEESLDDQIDQELGGTDVDVIRAPPNPNAADKRSVATFFAQFLSKQDPSQDDTSVSELSKKKVPLPVKLMISEIDRNGVINIIFNQ